MSRMLRVAALAALAVFIICLAAEHILQPSLSPTRHMISEYVHGRGGAVMLVGFAFWAISLVACAIVVKGLPGGRALTPLLMVAAAAVVVLGLFATQTWAGVLPPGVHRSLAGRLHDAGSGVSSLALFLAAIVSLVTLRRPVLLALVVVAIAISAIGLAIGRDVGGLRQRGLVLCAVSWQASVLAISRDRRLRPGP
jgi:hypothetical protein